MTDTNITSEQKNDHVQGFHCGDCGGKLKEIARGSTDASLWREHKCVDCGGEGSYYNSHSSHTPHLTGVTERKTNLSADGGCIE